MCYVLIPLPSGCKPLYILRSVRNHGLSVFDPKTVQRSVEELEKTPGFISSDGVVCRKNIKAYDMRYRDLHP